MRQYVLLNCWAVIPAGNYMLPLFLTTYIVGITINFRLYNFYNAISKFRTPILKFIIVQSLHSVPVTLFKGIPTSSFPFADRRQVFPNKEMSWYKMQLSSELATLVQLWHCLQIIRSVPTQQLCIVVQNVIASYRTATVRHCHILNNQFRFEGYWRCAARIIKTL